MIKVDAKYTFGDGSRVHVDAVEGNVVKFRHAMSGVENEMTVDAFYDRLAQTGTPAPVTPPTSDGEAG